MRSDRSVPISLLFIELAHVGGGENARVLLIPVGAVHQHGHVWRDLCKFEHTIPETVNWRSITKPQTEREREEMEVQKAAPSRGRPSGICPGWHSSPPMSGVSSGGIEGQTETQNGRQEPEGRQI